jgi:hypothetical protein
MTATSSFRKAAVGLRCHSGWAAAILLCGNRHEFTVLERYRLELCDSGIGGARQPYHHAESLPLADATAFIARSAVSAKDLADVALGSILKAATNRKLAVSG